jgi:phage terminase small subunit
MRDKRTAFIREYLVDMNATQAAIRAGYSPKSARVTGPRLLSNAVISSAIACHQKESAAKSCRNRDEWLSGINKLCDHDDPSIALKAHEQLGKAQGYNEPEKTEAAHTIRSLSNEDLKNEISRLEREIAEIAGSPQG